MAGNSYAPHLEITMDTTKWIGEEEPPMTTHAEGEEDPWGGYDTTEATAFGEF